MEKTYSVRPLRKPVPQPAGAEDVTARLDPIESEPTAQHTNASTDANAADKIEEYTKQELQDRARLVRDFILANPAIHPVEKPTAILLAGQQGAGKGALQSVLKDRFGGNIAVVNSSEFYELHPRFKQIQERFNLDSLMHIGKWVGMLSNTVVGALSRKKCNLVVVSELQSSELALRTAEVLRDRDYRVTLAVVATKPEISYASYLALANHMRGFGLELPFVDEEEHRETAQSIIDTVAELEGSDQLDEISVYSRLGDCLLTTPCPANDAAPSSLLHNVFFGRWTKEEESHYVYLQSLQNDSSHTATI